MNTAKEHSEYAVTDVSAPKLRSLGTSVSWDIYWNPLIFLLYHILEFIKVLGGTFILKYNTNKSLRYA